MLKKLSAITMSAALLLGACSGDDEKTDTEAEPAITKSQDGEVTAIAGGSDLFEGTGNGEVDVVRFGDDGDPVLVRITSTGNELSYIGASANDQTIVDTIGAYDGYSILSDATATELTITTLDSWTVQFIPISKAAKFGTTSSDDNGKLTASGEQPSVLVVPDGLDALTVTFETDEAFAQARPFRIRHVSEDGTTETVFERAGASADGQINVPGPGYLAVADIGTWTITET